MRIFIALLIPLLTACKDGGTPFTAPSPSEVSAINAQLYNRPDRGADIARFEVQQASHKAILASLNGAQQDNNPSKWQILGDIEITLATGSVDVSLFWTRKASGAFRVNGTYYRGGSDSEFIRLIEAARKQKSEQDGAANPAKPGG